MKTSKRFSDREVDFSESDHNMVIVEFDPWDYGQMTGLFG